MLKMQNEYCNKNHNFPHIPKISDLYFNDHNQALEPKIPGILLLNGIQYYSYTIVTYTHLENESRLHFKKTL